MLQTISNQLTAQFYAWEQKGRGWHVFEEPVDLEPAFEPFFFHALPMHEEPIIDDGRRPTLASAAIAGFRSLFKKNNTQPSTTPSETVIEAYRYKAALPPVCFATAFPKGHKITAAETEQTLLILANCRYPVSFEIVATEEKIVIQYTCAQQDARHLHNQLKSFSPLCVLIEKEDALLKILDDETYILDFGLREEFMRPLAMQGSFDPDPLISLFGVLDYLQTREDGVVQILFKGCCNPWAESILRSVSGNEGDSFFADATEMVGFTKQKVSAPLFAVSIRAIGCSGSESRAEDIAWDIAHALMHLSRSSGNQLMPLNNDDYAFGDHVEDVLYRQTHRLGMLLNSKELATLAHYPSVSVVSAKLERETKKTKAAPVTVIGHSFVLGNNEHQSKVIPVSERNEQRLKHTHIIGATGTGKSTLLLSMITQDIAQKNGIAVLDPHGDLIEKILSYIPPERAQDVLAIDPADAEYPVGFNILTAHSEQEKDILSSDLVAAFRRLSTSWGDQMNSVFANAILAFLESTKGGTLADLRRFLTDKKFRETFLKTVTDPSIAYYWHYEFSLLKTGSIGSILTRLDAFLRPKLIRNMVCQQKSIDFDRLMQERKIILVKLSQGLIGAENSNLLGTFIVAKLHQAAMARQAIAESERTSFFLYADEFQHFITPSMSSILNGTRKYHLGLILAHQSMEQVSDAEMGTAVLNAGTRMCFRLNEHDAKKLTAGFSYFEAKDLQNLSVGEAIVRVERPEYDFSMTTVPLADSTQPKEVQDHIIAYSRNRYGTPKKEVEARLLESMQFPVVPEPTQKSAPATPQEKAATPIPEPLAPTTDISQQSASYEIKEITETPEVQEYNRKQEERRHTSLKNRIKQLAEARGYKATLEQRTPDDKGSVDVLLSGNSKTIACEVSVTTDATWELHNVQKCLAAGYDFVIVCTDDKRRIEKIRKVIVQSLTEQEQQKVFVCDPDTLFQYIDSLEVESAPKETKIKGWTVTTERTVLTKAEMEARGSVLKRILRKPPETE